MKLRDTVRLAAGGLRERKSRTALTILGIVIGTAMIVALMASSQGQSQAISQQLEKLGPTTLLVRSFGNNPVKFTPADVPKVEALDHVASAFVSVQGAATASRGGATESVSVLGIDPSNLPVLVKGYQVADGQMFAPGDIASVMLGASVADPPTSNTSFAGTGDPVQLQVTVRVPNPAQGQPRTQLSSHTYVVSGVAAPFGSAPFVDVDDTIVMDPRAAQQLLKIGYDNQLVVFADSPDSVAGVQTELQDLYGNNARVLSGTQIAQTVQQVFGSISLLLGSIAAISLVVAGVGIANTMFVSVIERTTEIGLMKAIGFKARNVLSVFTLEAALQGIIGGILGCVAGAGLAFALGNVFNPARFGRGGGGGGAAPGGAAAGGAAAGGAGPRVAIGGAGGFEGGGGGGGGGGGPFGGAASLNLQTHPYFSVELFVGVLVLAVVVAAIAGMIPARKAARMDAVVALKRL